ncbi:MAG: ribonuclease PH [Planctomycetota bacterium]|nr:ribonuclease PH [Planctomycetota bacterium]
MTREGGRRPDQVRSIDIVRPFAGYSAGSVLLSAEKTRIICTASIDENVPPFMTNSGKGWVTAEYNMLPGSTIGRRSRDERRGRVDGRTLEIQRMIGRSMRAAMDLKRLGERTIWIDCDVVQADGGTRTMAITGAYIAVADALSSLVGQGLIETASILTPVAAVSAGLIEGIPLLDLTYQEDSRAQVDLNVVMTEKGEFVEIQGAAEKAPFGTETLDALLELARKGIRDLLEVQARTLQKE